MKSKIGFAFLVMLFVGCGGKHTGDFLSDGVSNQACASSGCAVTDTNPYVSLKKTSTYYVKKSDLTAEVNGDCFVADSTSHTFALSVKQGVTSIAVPFRALNLGSPDQTALKCSQGKFSMILDISALNPGVYVLSGQLNVTKKDGSVSSPSTGSFIANISVSN